MRSPILIGESGAAVVRVRDADGVSWIEKSGAEPGIGEEAAVLRWCAGLLPVPRVIERSEGLLRMSELPGVNLTEVSVEEAVAVLAEALGQVHSVSIADCPFPANWDLRVRQAEERVRAGLVDVADFGAENLGRGAEDVLAELKAFPPLPKAVCFTHGDGCLENFLALDGKLSGIVDLGRAGVTHAAQDWALALRSMASNFGEEGERLLRKHLPAHCADEELLRRFRLLDELF